jgi:RNA polymerase sigma-70 factor (ECF subfamily)
LHRRFETLFRPIVGPAFRLAFGMLHDRQAAEDAIQDAACNAWRKFDTLKAGRDMRPWFLAIVANQCRTIQRGRWWSVLKFPDLRTEPDQSPDRLAQTVNLRRAIRRLPYSRRLPVVLYFYLDLPIEEVADMAGLTVDAARSRIYRALRDLRLEFEVEEALG